MNYFVDSPANYFNPHNESSMNQYYPGAAQVGIQESQVPVQN